MPSDVTRQPPAYGRGLVAVRMAGFHPLIVNVLYANDWAPAKAYQAAAAAARERKLDPFSAAWRERVGFPWVAVSPGRYEQDRVDWRVLAGVLSVLHDPEGRALEKSGIPSRLFFTLVNELAQIAYVSVRSAATAIGEMSAGSLAYRMSVFQGGRRASWPEWWSDELDREHGRRFEEWQRDAEFAWSAA